MVYLSTRGGALPSRAATAVATVDCRGNPKPGKSSSEFPDPESARVFDVLPTSVTTKLNSLRTTRFSYWQQWKLHPKFSKSGWMQTSAKIHQALVLSSRLSWAFFTFGLRPCRSGRKSRPNPFAETRLRRLHSPRAGGYFVTKSCNTSTALGLLWTIHYAIRTISGLFLKRHVALVPVHRLVFLFTSQES